jgi:hypothetical protein
VETSPAALAPPREDEKLDPLFKWCFLNLPPRTQRQVEAGNPRAVQALYRSYDLMRSGAPNRAARRKAARR